MLNDNKVAEIKNFLNKLLLSYQSNSKIVDHIYEEQLSLANNVKTQNFVKDQENKVIGIRIKTK